MTRTHYKDDTSPFQSCADEVNTLIKPLRMALDDWERKERLFKETYEKAVSRDYLPDDPPEWVALARDVLANYAVP